jgi:molecular chaperone GrpE (heat shock protein)
VEPEAVNKALKEALLALIEVVDNCDYALDQLEGQPQNPYRQGLLMVRNKTLQRAHSIGLRDFTTRGGHFDTTYHEAISTAPGGQNGQIERVLRRGWTFDDRTLRYAQVIVFEGGGPDFDDDDINPPASGGRRRLR